MNKSSLLFFTIKFITKKNIRSPIKYCDKQSLVYFTSLDLFLRNYEARKI